MRTLARAAIAVAVTSSACATDRPVTWEDLGLARAEPRNAQPRPAPPPTPPEATAPPEATKPALAEAIDDVPPQVGPAAEAPKEPPVTTTRPADAVDLTPRGRVTLPGVQAASVEDGALVRVDAMTLVCIADARALVETALVFDRLDEEAQKLGATLGATRVIRLARDPARSISDPPPRACRTLVKDATLKSPLSREQEPKATWLVTSSSASLIDDSARASARVNAGAHKVTAAPRAVVDESGAIVALVIPVEPAPGGT